MATRQIKSTNYYSHDSNARNDEKLVRLRMRHGAAGYGVYFMILERLREEADCMSAKDYNMIAFDLRVDAAIVKSVVEDFGLFTFTDDGKCFYSESFNRRVSIKDTLHRLRSDAGKTGMRNRWQKDQPTDSKTKGRQNKEEEPKPKPEDNTPKPALVKPSADNQACLKRFFGKENSGNLEVLFMNFGLKPDNITMLRKMAKEVVAEWEISKKEHSDYTDWSQHLIATMRIKCNASNQRTPQRMNPNRQDETSQPPSASDYQTGNGFGSKDI